VRIVACGTSWHSGLAGKFMIERLARLPAKSITARVPLPDPMWTRKRSPCAFSQSGENPGHARRTARIEASKARKTLAISTMGSMITREAAGTILRTPDGDWLASTKAFTSQPHCGGCCCHHLASCVGNWPGSGKNAAPGITKIPHKIETALQPEPPVSMKISPGSFSATPISVPGTRHSLSDRARRRAQAQGNLLHPREGYPAGEMKHGPNALIDENLPVVVLATRDDSDPDSVTRYEKSVSNIKEVKARAVSFISIVTVGDRLAREASDHIIELRLPRTAGSIARNHPGATTGLSYRRAPGLRRSTTRATWAKSVTVSSPRKAASAIFFC